jgi:hypothetical protein
VNELERRLTELEPERFFPETPHLVDKVTTRIPSDVQHRRRPVRVAVAVAAGIIGVLIVVLPGPRSAIANLFGIGAVEFLIVDSLPQVEEIERPAGTLTTLETAQAAVDFRIQTLPEPATEVYLATGVAGDLVTLVYESENEELVLAITLMTGETDVGLLEKILGPGSSIAGVETGHGPAFWIDGEPHVVVLRSADGLLREDRPRLAGNTLIVVIDGVTIRIEGDITLAQAIAIADAMQ